MEKPLSDKDKFRQALEAYAVAYATGNQILKQSSGMLVEQYLQRFPDKFPEPAETTTPEPVNTEPGGMP